MTFHILVEVRTTFWSDTVNPAIATGTLIVVTAVIEQVVLDEHVVPNLVVRTLLTDESAYKTLETAVLDDQRVEGHSHTVAIHIEEVVTGSGAQSGLVVAVVEALGVVEVDVVEGQLLHVDFAALTGFRLASEHEHGVGALPLLAVGALVVAVVVLPMPLMTRARLPLATSSGRVRSTKPLQVMSLPSR